MIFKAAKPLPLGFPAHRADDTQTSEASVSPSCSADILDPFPTSFHQLFPASARRRPMEMKGRNRHWTNVDLWINTLPIDRDLINLDDEGWFTIIQSEIIRKQEWFPVL